MVEKENEKQGQQSATRIRKRFVVVVGDEWTDGDVRIEEPRRSVADLRAWLVVAATCLFGIAWLAALGYAIANKDRVILVGSVIIVGVGLPVTQTIPFQRGCERESLLPLSCCP